MVKVTETYHGDGVLQAVASLVGWGLKRPVHRADSDNS